MPSKTLILDYEPVTPSSAGATDDAWVALEQDHDHATAAAGGEAATPVDEWEVTNSQAGMRNDVAAAAATANIAQSTASENLAETVERGHAASVGHALQKQGSWILKRGHAISFAGLYLFTLVLFFRPYEYVPGLSGFTQLAFVCALLTLLAYVPSQLAIEGTLTARPREVNFILLLCLAALLSVPLAIDPGLAWKTFNDVFIKAVVMFIVMVNVVRTERRLRSLLLLAVAVTCALSVNALRDYSSGNLAVEGYRIEGSIGGMFGNPNDLALHFATMVPIAGALFVERRGVLKRAFYGASALLFVAASMVTYSRGGFLGLACGAGVLAWKIGRRNRVRVVVGAMVLLPLLILFAPGDYGQRIGSTFGYGADKTGSSTARRDLLEKSINVALHNPVLGIGMGNFPLMSNSQLVAHNAYTETAAEMGMMALVFYTIFIISPFRRLRVIERETYEVAQQQSFYYLAIGLQASLAAYMVCSFFGSVQYIWYVYYLVGYSVCLRRLYEARIGGRLPDASNER